MTPEQAGHDRERDRLFVANGIQVFRFTGAQLYANPFKCATEAVQYVTDGTPYSQA